MLVEKDKKTEDDTRKQDFKQIKLSENLEKGKYIDVRIKRKDGTDDVVLSKKLVLDIAGETIWINISETDRNYINNATVEANTNEAELYTTIYVNPENQVPALITYKINPKLQQYIRDNSDVVKKAEQEMSEKIKKEKEENQMTLKQQSNDQVNPNNVPLPQQVPANNDILKKNTNENIPNANKKDFPNNSSIMNAPDVTDPNKQ